MLNTNSCTAWASPVHWYSRTADSTAAASKRWALRSLVPRICEISTLATRPPWMVIFASMEIVPVMFTPGRSGGGVLVHTVLTLTGPAGGAGAVTTGGVTGRISCGGGG